MQLPCVVSCAGKTQVVWKEGNQFSTPGLHPDWRCISSAAKVALLPLQLLNKCAWECDDRHYTSFHLPVFGDIRKKTAMRTKISMILILHTLLKEIKTMMMFLKEST